MPQRGDKRALMETVARNAGQSLALHKTRRASDLTTRSQALEEIQEALGLAEAPLRIECYDVSNLQGTEVVASMVVFEDGLARKSEYRRFVITGVDGQNDVAAIHEIITRRFRRLLDERAEPTEPTSATTTEEPTARRRSTRTPAGRASSPTRPASSSSTAARRRWPPRSGRSTSSASTTSPLVRAGQAAGGGLAARATTDPVILPRTSEGLYLLQRVRDEAHRFAITHHRNRRSKTHGRERARRRARAGRGPAQGAAAALRLAASELRAATVDEIAAVPGHRPAHGRGDRRRAGRAPAAATPAINTATGEIIDEPTTGPQRRSTVGAATSLSQDDRPMSDPTGRPRSSSPA